MPTPPPVAPATPPPAPEPPPSRDVTPVEDEYTRQLLADLGCTLAQGWLTAHAMPPDRLPTWLAAHDGGLARVR